MDVKKLTVLSLIIILLLLGIRVFMLNIYPRYTVPKTVLNYYDSRVTSSSYPIGLKTLILSCHSDIENKNIFRVDTGNYSGGSISHYFTEDGEDLGSDLDFVRSDSPPPRANYDCDVLLAEGYSLKEDFLNLLYIIGIRF